MSAAGVAAGDTNLLFGRRSEMLLAAGLLAVLVVLLAPLPPMLLDMLLALNLALSVLLLLITLSAKQPLEVAVFPSLLLLLTLYRLSLNVATTRLILLDGDAGKIVETFGGFVVGGNLVVGLVIFAILVLIQFIVITKGSSRISEVNARFTLDAMPGKQMAIDAEVTAGSLTPDQAKKRREMLTREAEFYGAMDGAAKYVRGDAIAGLLITLVNLVGGVTLGMMDGLPLADAVKQYSILTVGDGLVSQIPALIIAVTSGILVTKSSTQTSLGQEIGTQLLSNTRPLMIGAVIMMLIAFTPGLPKTPFFLLSGGLALFLRRRRHQEEEAARPKPKPTDEDDSGPDDGPAREEQQLTEFIDPDRVAIEIGAGLIPLVETKRTKGLKRRIVDLRRDLTRKHGLWVPTVRIRDNYKQESHLYRILIAGREVGRGRLQPDKLLAIDPGNTTLSIDGEETTDPTFGMPARWIDPSMRHRAKMGGYTVVDAPNVLITHLGEVLRRFAHELLSREDLQKMLKKVRDTAPTVVEELKPDLVRMGAVHQVLVRLLQERVPITNLAQILESLAHHAATHKDPAQLVERMRDDLGRSICERFRDERGKMHVVVLDPRLESALKEVIREQKLALAPAQLERLLTELSKHWQKSTMQGRPLALLTDRTLRWPLRHSIERALPELAVIAYTEVPADGMIEPAGMIRLEDVWDAPRASVKDAARDAEPRNLLDALHSPAA